MDMEKNMATEGEDKVVQTELPRETYERLRRVAEREDRTLKAVVSDAVEEYVRRAETPDADDPFFNYDPPTDVESPELAADRVDEYLYGDE